MNIDQAPLDPILHLYQQGLVQHILNAASSGVQILFGSDLGSSIRSNFRCGCCGSKISHHMSNN